MFRALFFGILIVASPVFGESPSEWADSHIDSLVEVYRDFHRHPELSFQEEKTAERLGKQLEKIGATMTRNVGGHGVVAILANGEGPTVMLRTDLDGLPVTEETDLVYSSKAKAINAAGNEVGVMHACGHDIHLTNLIGVAQYLASHKDHWSGTAMFIGQPAEERGAGAKAMLEDGLFERFRKPDFALALHVDANLEAGKMGYRAGYSLANVDSVDIEIKGRGGHGAYPHATIDPIVQAAHLVMDLQTIVSREVKPIEPAVITVGSIHGGTKHNVIGNSCELQITVRSYSDDVRKQLHEAIKRKAKAVALSANAEEPTVTISEGTPSLWNDRDLTDRLVPIFKKAIGDDNVTEGEPSMGGEDFSRYGKAGVPILMFRLGTIEPNRLKRYRHLGIPAPSLHSSKYYPDAAPTLKTGIAAMASAAMELMPPKTKGN